MKILDDESMCVGCGLCADMCPKKAITMKEKNGGFAYPAINNDLCVHCNVCKNNCPVLKSKIKAEPVTAYAFKASDTEERLKSASGGASATFMRNVLNNNGIATGVMFDSEFNAVHRVCDSAEKIDLFRDSKYVQSDMSGIFDEIQSALNSGKQTLVTGTPCQIAAVRSRFGDNGNLILVDLVCHGVPSPLVLKLYIKELEQMSNKKVVSFLFRDKTNGWSKSNIKVTYEDGSVEIIERSESDFFKLFGRNLIFRPSCHHCNFRNFNIFSDITIGDYWGIEKMAPDFFDESGCSFVMINSEKGKIFFDSVKKDGEYFETGVLFAVETHSKLTKSIPEGAYKKGFVKQLDKCKNANDFIKLSKTYTGSGIIDKLKRKYLK